ncbi:MAG: flagellin [Pseudomonadota bacterium]
MASLIVNRSAQVALRTLDSARDRVAQAQDRLGTGLKIQSPAQNAAFFLVAATTRSDVVVTQGVRENLVQVDSAIATSFAGLGSLRNNLDNIRSAIIAGENAGYDNGLNGVIQGEIDVIRDTIQATQIGGMNFLADGGALNVVTALTRRADGGLKTQVLTVQSLALDKQAQGVGEGQELIPADAIYDLTSGGSVIRFGSRYKVTSLTTDNIARNNGAFNAYRDGPGAADPAPQIVHPNGSNKQWLLSEYSDDFRTRRGTGNSVFGFGGNDRLISGTNNSVLVGGSGDDYIVGGRNGDRAFGGEGDDFVRVTRNGNIADGGAGNDRVAGGNGAEILYGGSGDDLITGGGGADTIIGGSGSDDIRAGGGADLIYEGFDSGSDSIRLNGGGGTVFYEGDASRYSINIINGSRFTVTDNVTGDVDDIRNGTPADLVFGVAPPADPDTPVPADFTEAIRVDFATLADPVNGQSARDAASFITLVRALDPDNSGYTVEGALAILDSALQKLNFGESQLGSIQKTIQRAMSSADLLTDSLNEGISDLVEVDYAEESAILASAQVQEQLAVDGLRLSAERSSLVLRLFS